MGDDDGDYNDNDDDNDDILPSTLLLSFNEL